MKSRSENENAGVKKSVRGIKGNTGFYIALAVCIITVAAAAWTTYGGMLSENDVSIEESSDSGLPAANDVSGESYEKSEKPQESSSKPDDSAKQKDADNAKEKQKAASDNESSDVKKTAVKSTAKSDETPAVKESSGSEEAQKILFPVNGSDAVKQFSLSEPVFSKTTADWRAHKGIDIRAKNGEAVLSVSRGVVTETGADPLLGNMVTVEQSGYTVRYCGLSDRPVVSKGDHVEAGTVIGYVGKVPCEMLDEDHIHLEVRSGDMYVDPMLLFEGSLSK